MALDMFALDGRVAAVTGAASGLGLAMAEALASAGATVVLLDIDQAGLAAASETIRAAGGRAETALLDVSDRKAIRATIDDIAARHGRLDAAIANAGVTAGPGYRTEIDGLYLCGPSMHPGGGIHGGCGYNAYKIIAKELDLPSPIGNGRPY